MLYARASNGEKVLAMPKAKGECSGCGGEMRAKCGSTNSWHWAHLTAECDPWHQGEGAWHLGWKAKAPRDWVEVSMGPHRADIRRSDGLVIELQASAISAGEIAEREAFYTRNGNKMVWLLDGREFDFAICLDWVLCCFVTSARLTPNNNGYYEYEFLTGKPPCGGEHDNRDGLWRVVSDGQTFRFVKKPQGPKSRYLWKRRKRSFDRANSTVYVDLGLRGVYELRNTLSDFVRPEPWWPSDFVTGGRRVSAHARSVL